MEAPWRELILSSFGTIGKTYEDRLRFWRLVEEHEPEKDARIQNRLICELPHQATPLERKEILTRFTAQFEAKSIPYHVAIHAPGAKNDARNYHAHIVFMERPAKKMIDPETGEEEWDFAITRRVRDSSRHYYTTHPFRQKKDRDLNKKTFITDLRKHYATCVNAVMAPIDPTVKFDPRSYEAMGLDTAPMKSVYRVVADRMNDGKLVIKDADWTRRMIEAKMEAAATARDPDVIALRHTTAAITALKTAWPDLSKINQHLGSGSKLASLGSFTRKTFVQVLNHRLALEHAITERKVLAKAELEVCQDVMNATRPPKIKARGHVDLRTPEEQEEVRVLFEAAKDEYVSITSRMKTETFTLKCLLADNKRAWAVSTKALASPPRRRHRAETTRRTHRQGDVRARTCRTRGRPIR